jgi:hypothetical protein
MEQASKFVPHCLIVAVCSNQRRDSSSDKVPIALAFSGAAPAQQNKTNLKLKAYLLKLEVASKPYPSKQTRKENPTQSSPHRHPASPSGC